MLDKVIAYIEENQLIQRKDRIVVGISGGADSVCLFFVLLELKERYDLELFAVHVHHGIRGGEADRDQAFVEELAKREGVFCFTAKKNVPELAREASMTEEEAGRMARYEAFYECMGKVGGNKIAVAHNKNDCAETVLFQLFRGSGLKGLCGIPPKRGPIIRPLLAVERKEIEGYLEKRGQFYCTDRTNFEQQYARNKIRLSLLPFAEQEINGKAVFHIARTAQYLREVESYVKKNVNLQYEEIVYKKNGQYFIELEKFSGQEPVIQKELIKLLLSQAAGEAKDIEAKHIESLLALSKKQSGKKLDLPYGLQAKREYKWLVVAKEEKKEKEAYSYELKPGKRYRIEEAGWEIELELAKAAGESEEIPQNTCMKWFDYDRIVNVIQIRSRKPGDYLQINKEGGTKKLKDYFIDKKVPRDKRQQAVLLADGSHIIWIIGDRISEKYKVTGNTKNILKIRIREVKENVTQNSSDDTRGRGRYQD